MAHLRGQAVKSAVSKRSIVIAGHKTSVTLEDEFWNGLKEIASEPDDRLAWLRLPSIVATNSAKVCDEVCLLSGVEVPTEGTCLASIAIRRH